MAYAFSGTDLAAVAAYLAADKPLLGTQSIPLSPPTVKWHNSGSTADRTDPIYPARRAYDGLPGYVTKPTAVSADKTWYYHLETYVADAMEIDFVAILNHNLGTTRVAGNETTVTLEIDDSNAFGTAISIPVFVTSSASDARIIQLSLKHTGSDALRYSSVRNARLKITRGATNFTPQIGQIILGRRRQLRLKPLGEYDPTNLHGNAELTTTMGGVKYNNVFSAGERRLSAEIVAWDSTRIADLVAFAKGTNYMTEPFVWIESPGTAPSSWHYMMPDAPDFDFPRRAWIDRRLILQASEQGPESCYLDRGVY